MEFGRGIPPPKQKSPQIRGPWMPTTASKAHEQINRLPPRPLWLTSGVLGAVIAQENACENGAAAAPLSATATTAGMQLNPTALADRVPDLQSWKAAIAAQTQVSSLSPYMEALQNGAAMSRSAPNAHLLKSSAAAAMIQRANNAATMWSPISHMQNKGGSNQQQQSNPAATLLCANQVFLPGSTQSSNITCFPQQMPQHGLPIPYHAAYDQGSPAKIIADAMTNGTLSFQPAPLTPDRGKSIQINQKVEVSGLSANGRLVHENENVDSLPPTTRAAALSEGLANLPDTQGLLESMCPPSPLVPSTKNNGTHNFSNREDLGENSPAAALSAPVKENQIPVKGKEQGIDLNKAPQQKPKRKKHRPKVVREDKPKRNPKTVIPNQAKEGPSAKRKYVRRAAPKTSASPANAQETINPNGRTSVGSCKRHLDFNLVSTAGEAHPGTVPVLQYAQINNAGNSTSVSSSTSASNLDAETRCLHQHAGINHSFGSKSTLQMVAEELKAVSTDSPVETTLDLNHSVTQSKDGHMSLPSNANSCQTITQEYPSTERIKALAMKSMGSSGSCINIHHIGHVRMNHNIHASQIDCRINPTGAICDNPPSMEPSRLQNGLPLLNENQQSANSRSQASLQESSQIKMGLKRAFDFTVDQTHPGPVNLHATHSISMQAQKRIIQQNQHYGSPDVYFQKNNKKMKTDMMNRELASNLPPPVTVLHDSVRRTTAATPGEIINDQLAQQISDARAFPLCNLVVGIKKPQNVTCYTVCDANSQPMAGTHSQQVPGMSREVFLPLNTQKGINLNEPQAPMSRMSLGNIESSSRGRLDRPVQTDELASFTAAAAEFGCPPTSVKMAVAYNDRWQSNSLRRPQAHMETLGADRYAKMKTIASTKELDYPVYSIFSATNQEYLKEHKAPPVYAYHQSCIESRVATPVNKPIGLTMSSSENSQPRNSKTVPASSINDCQSRNSIQQMLFAGSPLQRIATYTDPVDEIVQRLASLNINSGSKITTAQPENALVPYEGDRKLIPYEGPLDSTKKRHPRPKVDLDPETDRVWKLLMWKEGSDATEGMDAAKEKWWEEERKVFRGRADSFIARMHLVQGDRRFSPWKGSVVDSVVGVFLTQNVSDQLSSSAFMALAARFPLRPRSTTNDEGKSTSTEEQDVSVQDSDHFIKQQSKISSQEYGRGSMGAQEVDPLEEKEMASSNESFGSNMGACTADCRNSKNISASHIGSEICQESSENGENTAFKVTKTAHLMGVENGKAMEYAGSSQVSIISSQNSTESIVQAAETIGSSSESNSEAENIINQFDGSDFNYSTSFLDLLQMEGTNILKELYVNEKERIPSKENIDNLQNQHKDTEKGRKMLCNGVECFNISGPSSSTNSTPYPYARQEFKGIVGNCSSCQYSCIGPKSDSLEIGSVVLSGEGRQYFPSTASGITKIKHNCCTVQRTVVTTEYMVANEVQRNQFSNAQTILRGDSHTPISTNPVNSSPTSVAKPYTHLDAAESSSLMDKQTVNVRNIAEPSLLDEVYSSNNMTTITKNDLKERRSTSRADKRRAVDWDSLRKQVCPNGLKKERSSDTTDSADWEAVRCADVNEIAKTIRERGMSNMLSERIKDFLNRLVREHGSIDLEWLRDVPPDKAKDYLLSIRGLGLKSVECVRLLTLHHLAFPVDTNVGRICVRLGWVPLQPLPESLQLHLLELYPLLETIQKYLWPRLCTLDQRTLYELHYQMITFGKVFCTKHKPNCNACPMRSECKHFASAFASARLALPGPEEKRLVNSMVPTTTEQEHKLKINLMSLPPPEESSQSQTRSRIIECEPIIEEPATPEPEYIDTLESAIEDAFWTEDPDEIPTIKLNIEEFTQNVQNYMQEKGELQDIDMSKALVALTQEAASIPMPKLKNISRLRTEHQVYELPDDHHLLAKLDKREPDDPCPYLLAIWTPGETAQSIKPPEIGCTSQKSGNLCSKSTCFTCNSIREADAQTVRGTLLIPCRTAMRGSFPLNGTYFQVNEVFADHDSSIQPINVPRESIWNLPRRTVYFGTSITTIFRGLTTEGIQQCFWRGFVCVRGFDQKTRAPRPLMARLHFPASKLGGTKKTAAQSD